MEFHPWTSWNASYALNYVSVLTHHTTSKTLEFSQVLRSFNLFLRGLVIAILEVWLAGMPPALVPGSLIAHSRLILSCCSSLILMLIAQPYSCAQQRHKDSLSILLSLQNPFAMSFERMMTNYNHQDISTYVVQNHKAQLQPNLKEHCTLPRYQTGFLSFS